MQILFMVETCTPNLCAKSNSDKDHKARVLNFRRLSGLFPWDPSTLLNAENSKYSVALLTLTIFSPFSPWLKNLLQARRVL